MVIDTSAIIAVLLNEATAARIAQLIERSSPRLLSAANLLETSIVIESRKGEPGGFAYALAKTRRLPLLYQETISRRRT